MHGQGAPELPGGFVCLRVALPRVDDALDAVLGGGAPLVGRGWRVERHQAEGALGQGFAQGDGFVKACHDEVRHARLQQRVGCLRRAVPVGVRLDDRPQGALRADVVLHGARVVLQRVPVQLQPVRGCAHLGRRIPRSELLWRA
jgi:hypothetical protein